MPDNMIGQTNARPCQSVLGLFPLLDDSGGVQRSGRVAWEAIANGECRTPNAEFGKLFLFCYGTRNDNGRSATKSSRLASQSVSSVCDVFHTSSKLKAALTAAKCRPSVKLVLVWHLGLLRLLPFFRCPQPRIALFLHGIEAWRRQGWLTRRLLNRVSLFLVNSNHTWERFVNFHPILDAVPHQRVNLGIGAPQIAAIAAPSQRPGVLMIGRLLRSEDYKGHREMIAAWPGVLRRIPEAELWVAGDGDLRANLEVMVRNHGLEHRIRFFGQISEEKKQKLLAQCRCLALPSRGEGFGLVYLEAMRLGRPCLVSPFDAGREVVNPPEAGLAVDPSDAEALADATCRLLTPGPEWEQWSTQARDRYESYFTARHFQDRLLTALNPLVN
jgi:glycosyltransferase involved in cell wall biosynthesis